MKKFTLAVASVILLGSVAAHAQMYETHCSSGMCITTSDGPGLSPLIETDRNADGSITTRIEPAIIRPKKCYNPFAKGPHPIPAICR